MPSPFMLFGGGAPRVHMPAALQDKDVFLRELGLSERELKKIWWFRNRMYREFDISNNGKPRLISAPDERLKFLQRLIALLLTDIYSRRNPVHGFVADRSVVTNAEAHRKSKFVVNLDIKSFFPSISENRVSGLLKALGVDGNVANIIARICTNKGTLPQGAPTSPLLSNMICFKLDKQLLSIAKSSHCVYTRYADDVTFSSYQPPNSLFANGLPSPGVFDPALLARSLASPFTDNGFALNPSKAHYSDRHSRRIVTGIKINQGLNVDRRFVRDIRAAIYFAETRGLSEAQNRFKDQYGGRCHVGDYIRGKIGWVGCVKGQSDPVFRALAERYNVFFKDRKIRVQPTAEEVRSRAVWVVEHFEGEDGCQGTAFFLKDVGLVTAWHCVQDAVGKEIELYHPTRPSNVFNVRVKRHHLERDLAILEHKVPQNEYFELQTAGKDFAVGERLTAVGYPSFAPGDGLNVRPGQISSFSVKHAVPLIEVTQKLAQGMSGGPVLDADGKVAGVIHKGGPGEGRDFAVHVKALTRWLAE